MTQLRERGIGNEEELGQSATAGALTVLFLRSWGVKFREDAGQVIGGEEYSRPLHHRCGRVRNRD